MKKEQYNKIIGFLEEKLSDSPHDLDHVYRVLNLSKKLKKMISESNNQIAIDEEVLYTAVLLHDIARVDEDNDETGLTDHAQKGAIDARVFLESIKIDKNIIDRIVSCIKTHRYRKGASAESIEAEILYDADKLDAIGAIGVARSFGWIGKHNAKIYFVPDSIEEYLKENMNGDSKGIIKDKSKHSVQIEFEVKLKEMQKNLYTKEAKMIAEKRLRFFEEFLIKLHNEVIGIE
ncbi:HD domain-containing protein [Anaerosacchariphilus polymeriproducens]|uniref:HD domain-containing protein n=1 Tax=Anaerosacchariphilus polymeriproducens TaxID=1812858 RepID=A0A371AZN8_9FIRM|nr:HD domain-containing protein [Anaerosacchariphilus polymeriproducens]RDU24962.1 HD domain-containing protein [Anaerosacchariphilus polymeriproducens]